MPIKDADQHRLNDLYAKYQGTYGGRKEDYFALLHLTRKFGVDVEEIAHQVVFGGNDYGLDAYFIDREARNLYLYQFKWSEDHGQFRGSMERLATDGLDRIFGDPLADVKASPVLDYLRRDLKENRERIDRVYLRFVFKGDVDAAEKSEGVANRLEDIGNKRHLITSFYGRDVELLPELMVDKIVWPPPPPNPGPFTLHLQEAGLAEWGNRTMRVGFVPLVELHSIYKGLGQMFFARNIR